MADAHLLTVLRHVRQLAARPRDGGPTDGELLHAFARRRDEDAFAALVRRHGPMVLGVCRRVLHHRQDAEDAFQATFLILARKAAALRDRTALAAWLYGSAYRMALSVRRAAARRRVHEGRITARVPQDPAAALSWGEVQGLLEEEIQRLPEKYRMAFVLCCMEGVERAEAARRLGLKPGTLSSRLDQAKKQLCRRLASRGVTLAAVLAASALAQEAGATTAATSLVGATARAASAPGKGVPARVAVRPPHRPRGRQEARRPLERAQSEGHGRGLFRRRQVPGQRRGRRHGAVPGCGLRGGVTPARG
jgi:RNA polymerase sigma factor (sigma-70 family)